MSSDDSIKALLRKDADLAAEELKRVSKELASRPQEEDIVRLKHAILRKIELHVAAEDAIESEVMRFREQLYTTCLAVAQREMESNIVTESHVIRARQQVWIPAGRYKLEDGYLALGGLLAGAAIPHLFDISPTHPANTWLIIAGFFGMLLLGMGIIGKAKG